MMVRSIDVSGDWNFGKGKNSYKKGQLAIAQNIRTRVQSFLGDCFFAVNEGIDWFNILGENALLELRLSVAATILKTPDVIEIIELSVNLSEDRVATIQYRVSTNYGQVSSTVTQGVPNA